MAVSALPTEKLGPELKRVSVLGATGSVGANTVEILALARADGAPIAVEALVAGRNAALLAEQALALRPAIAVIADETRREELEAALRGTGVAVAAGPAAVVEAASRPADWVMAAIVGAAGLAPTLAAARGGATIALANKECLVSAGDLLRREVARGGGDLLPVDSEHNALFQSFDFERPGRVEAITLTASGGPFRTWSAQAMARATRAEALAHPNWSMGDKITIDSATMMNKGLEIIEAHHLFPVREDQIKVVVHPESIIHGLVSYIDGSVIAQLGAPDMRTPIVHALAWPDRLPGPAPRLDLAEIGRLTFEAPDETRFPALRLARAALVAGGAAPTVLNAANEVAVAAFLAGRITFPDIAGVVEDALEAHERDGGAGVATLDAALAADRSARDYAETRIAARERN